MIWAVVPVKDLARAKQRLAGALSPEHRKALCRAMLDDVLSALTHAHGLAGILVVSSDPLARLLASRHGAHLLDDPGEGLNEALAHAAAALAAERQEGILIVPADAPLIGPGDVHAIIAAHHAGAPVVLAPDRRGDGTNALLSTPPDLISFRYGHGSFGAHAEAARALGIEPRILDLPGLALDIDTPDDLADFAALARSGAAREYLGNLGLIAGFERYDPVRKVV